MEKEKIGTKKEIEKFLEVEVKKACKKLLDNKIEYSGFMDIVNHVEEIRLNIYHCEDEQLILTYDKGFSDWELCYLEYLPF